MWAVVLSLLAALIAGFLIGGGPVLWLSVLVGLAVFGGDPGDPLDAVLATTIAFVLLSVLRARMAHRLQR